jgi:polysaccharide export outer membrane protein
MNGMNAIQRDKRRGVSPGFGLNLNLSLRLLSTLGLSFLLCLLSLGLTLGLLPPVHAAVQPQGQSEGQALPPTPTLKQPPSQLQAPGQDYSIGPEDVLKVSVWDHPDLTLEEVDVSLEGYISFPLIGQVSVKGLTTSQVEQRLRKLLADGYIVNPQVRVTVAKFKSKVIYILGEVKSPGAFPLTRNEMKLIEVISMAQGVTQDAGREAIIVRPQKMKMGNPHPIPIEKAAKEELITANLGALLEGNLKENLTVRGGDTIYIPRLKTFFIMGEVARPGKYILEEGTTVLKAIGIAGGLTPDGAQSKIRIVKEKDGKKEELPVKIEDSVEPEVTVFVPRGYHFFITGEVNHPGRYSMEEDITVMQAISIGGGLTAKGSSRRIKIIRSRDGRETKTSASLNDRVDPEDTILVPERFF